MFQYSCEQVAAHHSSFCKRSFGVSWISSSKTALRTSLGQSCMINDILLSDYIYNILHIDYGPPGTLLTPLGILVHPFFQDPYRVGNPTRGVIKPKSAIPGVIQGVLWRHIRFFRLNFKVLFIAAFWTFFAGFGDWIATNTDFLKKK